MSCDVRPIAAMICSAAHLFAWQLSSTRPSRPSPTESDRFVSSCAGQRTTQPLPAFLTFLRRASTAVTGADGTSTGPRRRKGLQPLNERLEVARLLVVAPWTQRHDGQPFGELAMGAAFRY